MVCAKKPDLARGSCSQFLLIYGFDLPHDQLPVFTNTQIQLLHALADGQFHTSRKLAKALGVSHSTVSQQIRGLKQVGLEVHAVHGKGTRLAAPLDLLNQLEIKKSLNDATRSFMNDLLILPETASTNQYLLQQNQKHPMTGLVCLAEMQTQGKGRRGRVWVSPFGQNIYLSVLWRFSSGLAGISGLSLACGVAVAKVLKAFGVEQVGLKWPNDLLWQGRKLGGILIEIQGETEGSCEAVIGLGLNVCMPPDSGQSIDQPWVDLRSILGDSAPINRNHLAALLINELLPTLNRFDVEGLEPLLEAWNQLDCLRGKAVQLINGLHTQTGVAVGITVAGELLLRNPDGELSKVHGGEVSLRAV